MRDVVSGQNVGAPDVTVSIPTLGLNRSTDDNGTFSIERVPVGQWPLQLTQSRPFDADRIRVVGPIQILFDGQSENLRDLELQDNGGLAGEVRLSDAPGPGGAGGTLVVISQTAFRSVTNEFGEYLFPQLPEGKFTLVAFRSGYAPGRLDIDVRPTTIQTARPITLVPGELPTRDVAGTVLTPETLDASMARIELTSEQGVSITIGADVGADGTYTVEGVPVGVYTVVAALPGAVTVSVFGVAVLPEAILGLGPIRLVPRPTDDFDADGRPDDDDEDRDNDGCNNGVDTAPEDPSRCADTDGDGIDDLFDVDDDGDTLTDAEEESPGVDGVITDPKRADSDTDGFRDDVDLCPVVPSSVNDPAFCTDASPIGPAPEVTGFQPAAAQVGEPVEVFGRHFIPGPFTRVAFGDGTVATPAAGDVTAHQISVVVPEGAKSGPLTVFNLGRVVTSTATFTVRRLPEPLQFEPTAAAPGATVAVFGRSFEPPLTVRINDALAQTVACDDGIVPPTGLEAVCFIVPDQALSGPITITTPVGAADTLATFFVLSGPRIDALIPSVLPPGGRLEIVGSGFGRGPADVRFGGGAVAPADLVTDTLIRVTVPPTATTGAVVVESAAGSVMSADPLVVEALIPAASRMFPTLAEVGDRLAIAGLNLAEAVEVEFAGGVRAPVVAPVSDSEVLVDVPDGVQPGAVTVHFPGGVTTTVPDGLSVMSRRTVPLPPSTSLVADGLVFNAARTEFYAIGGSSMALTVDVQTLQVTAERPLPENLQAYGNSIVFMVGDDSGTRTIIGAGTPSLVHAETGSFVQRALCTVPGRRYSPIFYNDGWYYIFLQSTARLGRFDLTNGTCSEVRNQVTRMAYAGGGLAYIIAGTQSVVDLDPLRPTFGQLVEPEIGTYSFPGSSGWGFFGLQNDVYGVDGILLRAVRRDPLDDGLRLERGDTVVGSYPRQSTNRRWVVIADEHGRDYIVDTRETQVAWQNGPLAQSITGLARAYVGGARFILYREDPTPVFLELTIDEAP